MSRLARIAAQLIDLGEGDWSPERFAQQRTYFSVGHDHRAPRTLWMWGAGGIQTVDEPAQELGGHQDVFPDFVANPPFYGRYDPAKKELSVVRTRNKLHTVPTAVLDALEQRFPDAERVYAF